MTKGERILIELASERTYPGPPLLCPPLIPDTRTEAQHGIALVTRLWTRPVLLWTHVGNERRGDGARIVAAGQGVSPGCPDYLIFDTTLNGMKGLAIELKRCHGWKISDEQVAWIRRMRQRGWVAEVAIGSDDAWRWVRWCYGC